MILNYKIIKKTAAIFLLSMNLLYLGGINPCIAQEPDYIQANMTVNQDTSTSSKAPLKGRAIMIDVNSEKLEYFQDKNEFVATGSARVYIPSQNSTLEADKITYDQDNDIAIAEGNVKITKNGQIIYGNYAKVELNKESALIKEPNTVIKEIKITAKTGNVYSNRVEAFKGKANVDNKDLQLKLSSVGGFSDENLNSKGGELNVPGGEHKPNYKITSKDIIVNNYPDRYIITVKNATVWLGKLKVAYIPSLTLNSSKESNTVETMLPEVGHNKQLGAYIGPGFVFNLPQGSTLKLAPLYAFGKDKAFGLGGFARFTSKTNKTEVGYSNVKDKLVVKGEQKVFTPNTKLIYGTNAYLNDGFLGNRLPGYSVELVDDRKVGTAYNFTYFNRASAGYMKDYNRSFNTARFKLQGDLINDKPLFAVHDDLLQMRIQSQYDFSIYGNGDTFGLVRLGPRFDSRLGPLRLSSAYFQSGIHGDSPFEFDRYMYGKSNLILAGDLKVTNNLSLGALRSFNLTKDNWNRSLVTENQLYARVGPDDVKFIVGYDFVRKRSTVGLDLLIGSGRTNIDFDRLRVNDIK